MTIPFTGTVWLYEPGWLALPKRLLSGYDMDRASPAKPLFLYRDWKQYAWVVCYTLSRFSLGSDLRGFPASVIPSTTILWCQLTGLARLSCNRKADFCCVDLRCRHLCKESKPSSCNETLSFIARIYALPFDLTDFSKQNLHTQNFSIHKHLHTPFSILNPLSLIHVLSIQILSKIAENNTKQKAI